MIRLRPSLTSIVGPTLVAILLLGTVGAEAQQMSREALQERLSRQRKALTEVEDQLRRRSDLIESERAQERSILLELEAADRQAAVIRTEADLAAREVATHQGRTKTLEAEISELEAQLALQQRSLAKHLRRLYRQRSLTTAQVLLTAPTLTAAAEQAKYTKRLAEFDRGRIKRYQDTLQALQARRGQLKTTASKLARARASFSHQADNLRRQAKAKRSLLASIQRERRLNEQALKEMEAAARDLQALVGRLESQPDSHIPSVVEKQSGSLIPYAVEREREAASQPVSFSLMKGRLPWPAHGSLVALSGRAARLHRGLTIKASEGDPIEAVAAGTVVFADTFRGYGNLCIIDHGTGYHTLYAHALEITVRVGERVEAGQVIGRVGSSGAAETPRLYFELRHRGRPIAPRAWMVAGAQ